MDEREFTYKIALSIRTRKNGQNIVTYFRYNLSPFLQADKKLVPHRRVSHNLDISDIDSFNTHEYVRCIQQLKYFLQQALFPDRLTDRRKEEINDRIAYLEALKIEYEKLGLEIDKPKKKAIEFDYGEVITTTRVIVDYLEHNPTNYIGHMTVEDFNATIERMIENYR